MLYRRGRRHAYSPRARPPATEERHPDPALVGEEAATACRSIPRIVHTPAAASRGSCSHSVAEPRPRRDAGPFARRPRSIRIPAPGAARGAVGSSGQVERCRDAD